MEKAINNLTRQIRYNLSFGDTPTQAVARSNVKKAVEIIALKIASEPKWLGNMSIDELAEGYNQSQMEKE